MAATKVNKLTSLAAYAKHRGVSKAAVTKAIQTGRLRKSLVQNGARQAIKSIAAADREWDANTKSSKRTTAAVKTSGSPQVAVSHARLEAARAELVELDLRQRKGELVLASEVGARFTEVVTAAKTKLLGVPSRVKQQLPHLSSDDVRVIDDLVREALEELADGR